MENGNPEESVGSNPENPKSAAIKRKWRHFIDNCTLHGIQHAINGQTKVRSVTWSVFLLIGTGYFVHQSYSLLDRYYSYPITTKVTLKYEEEPEFPAVTICNFNILRKSYIIEEEAEDLLELAFSGLLGTKPNISAVDWSKFDNNNMEEVYARGGHQFYQMMKKCSWSGEKCNHRNFARSLTSMGLCHTFNSGKFFKMVIVVVVVVIVVLKRPFFNVYTYILRIYSEEKKT